MKRMLYSLFLITLLWGVPNIWAQSDKDQNAAPDNTKVNTAKKILESTGAQDVSSTGEAKADFSKTDKPMERAS